MDSKPSASHPIRPSLTKWHRKTPAIITFLIIFWPLGLYLCWRYTNWSKWVKITLTTLYILVTILFGIFIANAPPDITVNDIDGSNRIATDNASYNLTGIINPSSATVTINDKPTTRTDDKFSISLPLQEGDNSVSVKAVDANKHNEQQLVIHRATAAEKQAKKDAVAKQQAADAQKAKDAAAKAKIAALKSQSVAILTDALTTYEKLYAKVQNDATHSNADASSDLNQDRLHFNSVPYIDSSDAVDRVSKMYTEAGIPEPAALKDWDIDAGQLYDDMSNWTLDTWTVKVDESFGVSTAEAKNKVATMASAYTTDRASVKADMGRF